MRAPRVRTSSARYAITANVVFGKVAAPVASRGQTKNAPPKGVPGWTRMGESNAVEPTEAGCFDPGALKRATFAMGFVQLTKAMCVDALQGMPFVLIRTA